MAVFHYEAIERAGKLTRGEVTAGSSADAVQKLQKRHLSIINIQEKKEGPFDWLKKFQHKVDDQTLAIFSRQFATLLRVGIPIARSIEAIARHITNKRLSDVLSNILVDLGQGFSVSKAFARYPDVFDEVYLAMVRIGDGAGILPEMLDKIASYQEKDYAIRRQIKAAMHYPIFIFSVSIIAVILMVAYFVPNFTAIYRDMKVALPIPTRILIGVVNIFSNPFAIIIILGAITGIGFLFYNYIKTPLGRYHVDMLRMRIPVLGQAVVKAEIARFCRSLATLIAAGINILDALKILEGIFGNEVVKDMLYKVQLGLKAGDRLSDKLKEYSYMPRIVSDMISVGEKTGAMEELLNKLADVYDMEAKYSLESVISLVEPAVITFLAFVVGFIMLSIFLPLYGVILNLGS